VGQCAQHQAAAAHAEDLRAAGNQDKGALHDALPDFHWSGHHLRPQEKFSDPNGLAIVEAFAADAWTKPTDLVYDAKKPLPKLGGVFADGFHLAFVNGGVRFIREPVNEAFLRSLFTDRPQPQGGFEKFDK